MTIPECDPPQPLGQGQLRHRLPPGTIDAHFHVFGPADRYPYAAGRSYTPAEASLAEYETLADAVGVDRAVIIQPSPYGLDNSRTLAAMAESRLPMRAVLVLDPSVSETELERYHALGVRGVRLNLLFKAGVAIDHAIALADRIRAFGWHLQFLADVSEMENLATFVTALRLPVVFDHLGHVPTRKGVTDRGFQALVSLLKDDLVWVKLSGAYRVTGMKHLPYDDARPFVDALLAANRQRLVWGSDWPHPSIPVPMPNDIALTGMMQDWIQDDALRQDIFVRNPERLYQF